ncbi:hypothetical protein KI387_005192, partial [Taxus chinensis]
VEAIQVFLQDKEMPMKASADSHYDLKCQFDMATEKLIASIEEAIQDETLYDDPCIQRNGSGFKYSECPGSLSVTV